MRFERKFRETYSPKYRYALDDDGNLVLASEGEIGKRYHCACCDTAQFFVMPRNGKKFFWTLSGTFHTGKKCSTIEKGSGKVSTTFIDKRKVLNNAIRTNSKKARQVSDFITPRAPNSLPDTVILFSTLAEIYRCKLGNRSNFPVDENSYLIDHFVSERNAYMVMDHNHSLGIRIIEADLEYVLPWRNTIRLIMKAHRNQNGKPTAARKIVDLICDDENTFVDIQDKLFYRYMSVGGKEKYFQRYKKALIVGDFISVPESECAAHRVCTKKCSMDYTHCTGRQYAKLSTIRQIYVDEADRMEFPIERGTVIR